MHLSPSSAAYPSFTNCGHASVAVYSGTRRAARIPPHRRGRIGDNRTLGADARAAAASARCSEQGATRCCGTERPRSCVAQRARHASPPSRVALAASGGGTCKVFVQPHRTRRFLAQSVRNVTCRQRGPFEMLLGYETSQLPVEFHTGRRYAVGTAWHAPFSRLRFAKHRGLLRRSSCLRRRSIHRGAPAKNLVRHALTNGSSERAKRMPRSARRRERALPSAHATRCVQG